MIYCRICDLENYYGINKDLDIAFDYLRGNDLNLLDNGKTVISDRVYINIFEYDTILDDFIIESHYQYLDIHVMLSGVECIGVGDDKNLSIIDTNIDDDYILYDGVLDNNILLKEGYVLVCFLNDIHCPKMAVDKSTSVRKAVIKVRVNKE